MTALGLVETGDGWVSRYLDADAGRVTLSVTANAGSVTLKPSGGCQG